MWPPKSSWSSWSSFAFTDWLVSPTLGLIWAFLPDYWQFSLIVYVIVLFDPVAIVMHELISPSVLMLTFPEFDCRLPSVVVYQLSMTCFMFLMSGLGNPYSFHSSSVTYFIVLRFLAQSFPSTVMYYWISVWSSIPHSFAALVRNTMIRKSKEKQIHQLFCQFSSFPCFSMSNLPLFVLLLLTFITVTF